MPRLFAIACLGMGAMLAATPALAQARQDVRDASQRCDGAGITDDRLWLECYYGAAQAMRSRLNLPPAPASQQRLVPQAVMIPPPAPVAPVARARASAVTSGPQPLPRRSDGWFGALTGSGKVVRANQRIESVQGAAKKGLFTVVLTNGERWEAVYGGDGDPNWRGNPVVNISEGALGTYNMKVAGDPVLYKVQRVNPR